jgi:hypothetical protein
MIFRADGSIYLPALKDYKTDTPCIVAWAWLEDDWDSIHQTCLDQGFQNWLNIAVVRDTCDEVAEQIGDRLVAAFNEDCRDGGWLWKMMNYRNPDSAQPKEAGEESAHEHGRPG